MPGNIVQVNNSDELRWYVGDSKMDNLIDELDKVGFRLSSEEENDGLQKSYPETQKKGSKEDYI